MPRKPKRKDTIEEITSQLSKTQIKDNASLTNIRKCNISVLNIIAHAYLKPSINIEEIKINSYPSKEIYNNRGKINAIMIEMEQMNAKIRITNFGRHLSVIICTKKRKDALIVVNMLIEELHDIGFKKVYFNYLGGVNMIYRINLGEVLINIEDTVIKVNKTKEMYVEQGCFISSNSCIIKYHKSNIRYIVYNNGKIWISGTTSFREIKNTWKKIYPKLVRLETKQKKSKYLTCNLK